MCCNFIDDAKIIQIGAAEIFLGKLYFLLTKGGSVSIGCVLFVRAAVGYMGF